MRVACENYDQVFSTETLRPNRAAAADRAVRRIPQLPY
jgi:hypothetical protein